MKPKQHMKFIALAALGAAMLLPRPMIMDARAADCPEWTVADSPPAGAFPQQYELSEYERLAKCELSFSGNPDAKALNARIEGNPPLPPVEKRLPEEPLIVAPYEEIGRHGGVFHGMTKATESGTSDLLSIRHANLLRYSDDLQTLVPNVAKGWRWNNDFTELTFTLRRGHKWSDGAPFTAEDVAFWYNDVILNGDIYPETPSRWVFGGNPAEVTAPDELTVRFAFPTPAPGIINRFAVDYGQTFLPKHFLSQFHAAHNSDAGALAQGKGMDKWAELFNLYYGGSDWKDVPSPLLSGKDSRVMPTLESHIVVEETPTGRRLVANPYFHMTDTRGQQLPYISEIEEEYVPDKELQNLKMSNGQVTFKQQAVFLEDFPLLKENEGKGNYEIYLAKALGETTFYSFNRTHKDPQLRRIFSDTRFSRAMSRALNRDEINDLVYLGQGTPSQTPPFEAETVNFLTKRHLTHEIGYDPGLAREILDDMGLKDSDGDGVRERADGQPLVVRLVYASQGAPVKQHELARDYWEQVGVRVDLKEVTSDEYRESANNNDLDLTAWKNDNVSAPAISQNIGKLIPPFGDYFNPGTGFEWATWKLTDGADGEEPPQYIKDLYPLAEKFRQTVLGTPESDDIGLKIADIHTDNILKVGVVAAPLPVYRSNRLGNIPRFTAKSYDYYWTYPYRPQQWFLK